MSRIPTVNICTEVAKGCNCVIDYVCYQFLFVAMPYIFLCATVESIQWDDNPIESSTKERQEMIGYVSRQVGQKWSMLARYAGLEEDVIQEIKHASQNCPRTLMKKIRERLTWNELLAIVQKHVSLCTIP